MKGRFEELVERLRSAEPGVRRVAVHDLIALGEGRVVGVLVEHLAWEGDEKAAVLVVRCLARAGAREAMPALLGLYRNPRTPVRVAHAAILAHDGLMADA